MPPMFPPSSLPLHHVLLLLLLVSVGVVSGAEPPGSSCRGGAAESCGDLLLPFPFHLNSSAACIVADGNSSSLFHLSCDGGGGHNATLTLTLGAAAFRVLEFLPSGSSLLLDYAARSAPPCDPAYAAFSRPSSPTAALDGAASFLAVAPANVLRLYACEDSSLCRAGCDDVAAPACAGKKPAAVGCCYPLSDGSVWKPGDGLGVFAGFGCRGFSSWVKNRSSATAGVTRGIEVEWAVPRGSALAACADGATLVNSTTVSGGVRCACASGLFGDGFAHGTGCSKRLECGDGDGDGGACCQGRFCSKKAVALAGFFVSVFFLAAAVSFWLFLRQPSGDVNQRWDLDPACIPKILGGVCNARQFTYEQLDAATRRFEDGGEKPVDAEGAVHAGVLDDGTVVAVQRIGYETQEKLRVALDAVSLLPEVSHPNIARVVGFCLPEDPGARALLLVHEHFAGGTLEDHLRRTVGGSRATLGWYHRVNIAIEIASALAYLQAHETAPTFLHDLRSSDVFLDAELTAKIAGHKLASSTPAATSYHHHYYGSSSSSTAGAQEQDVVCNFGQLLIELLTGLRHQNPFDSVAPKVREGRLHEVIDPTLLLPSSSSGKKSQGQLPAAAEEVRKVLELAVRCLLSAENGTGMVAVARELLQLVIRIRDDNNMGSSSKIEISLEETFSSSSLLQMISMSPDTLHRHLP
ncbi:probably inactive receptor-like protein kinase At2g46850 [Hordeum vulgare subsp. vulgare]|uniref:Protein kinase domain-containing protein n=1 Tax=Hordeum vulgare subsp. vulgare TaxID=112509 RepID=A0A8I6WJT9_HORVV|nr:probably inactive receptor-like protein kinase At2g46850 [Hordeum vulgare subsp. vulgare]